MNTNDHSLYAYFTRRTDEELLIMLGRAKLEKQTKFNRSIVDMLTEILTSRGVDTNIDLSLVLPWKLPEFIYPSEDDL